MARHIENEVEYYYDFHPTEEDLMGETSFHADLVIYLLQVLRWLFHGQLCAIYDNLNFYQTDDPKEYPVAPDIALIKGVSQQPARSWRVGKRGPAPRVVFEIGSEETWKKDLMEKPRKYAEMGVPEYYAYDPNDPPLSRKANRRLFGWHLDPSRHSMRELQPRSDGSLWSPDLESWLVPDGVLLRLYERAGQMRLTHAEFADQQADVATRKAELARQQTELAHQQTELAHQQTELAHQQAEKARQQAEAEARRSQKYADKLRSLGIDPDQLI